MRGRRHIFLTSQLQEDFIPGDRATGRNHWFFLLARSCLSHIVATLPWFHHGFTSIFRLVDFRSRWRLLAATSAANWGKIFGLRTATARSRAQRKREWQTAQLSSVRLSSATLVDGYSNPRVLQPGYMICKLHEIASDPLISDIYATDCRFLNGCITSVHVCGYTSFRCQEVHCPGWHIH